LISIVPHDAAVLVQIFPVLSESPTFRQLEAETAKADPQQRRLRLFTAVRELLTLLAGLRQVVILIDDLQWSDADSLSLLRELLRHARRRREGDRGPRLQLDEALGQRIGRLEPAARRILELVSLAAVPLPAETIAAAASIDFAAFEGQLSTLRAAHLVRSAGA